MAYQSRWPIEITMVTFGSKIKQGFQEIMEQLQEGFVRAEMKLVSIYSHVPPSGTLSEYEEVLSPLITCRVSEDYVHSDH